MGDPCTHCAQHRKEKNLSPAKNETIHNKMLIHSTKYSFQSLSTT